MKNIIYNSFFERSSLTLNSSYRCSLYFNVALFINKLLYINQYLMNIDLLLVNIAFEYKIIDYLTKYINYLVNLNLDE